MTLCYLHHDRSTRSYTPTTRVSRLGTWVNDRLYGEESPIDLLNHLRRATEETAVLGIQNDLATQYLLVMLSERPVCYYTKTGALRPLCLSGVGWALLSAMPDEHIRKLARRHNLSLDFSDQRVDSAELLASVARIRRDGYAFSRHTVTRGVGMIAMLLPAGVGGTRRAVGVGGPVDRLEEKRDSILYAMRSGIDRFMAATPASVEKGTSTTRVRAGRKVASSLGSPRQPAPGSPTRSVRGR